MTTYIYTKKFIDSRTKQLNQPLKISSNLKSILDQQEGKKPLTEDQLNKILAKTNVLVRNHNKTIFNNQSIAQVANQIVKLEVNKLLSVSEKLVKAKLILQPVLLPDFNISDFNQLDDLINELPEGKYLHIEEKGVETDVSRVEQEDDDNLIHDHEMDIVDSTSTDSETHAIESQIRQTSTNIEQIIGEYDDLRSRLLQLHANLTQSIKKRRFLMELGSGLEANQTHDHASIQDNLVTSNNHIYDELSKLRVLIEKVDFKINNLSDKEELFRVLNRLNR